MARTSPASAAATSPRPGRRRQRSVRVSVAVCLLSLATGLVLVALPAQSSVWLSIASVLSLFCGWAAARIVYSELVQSRREAAADRAEQAEAYRSMFAERASEHAEFTTAMTERLAASNLSLRELQGALVASQRETAEQRVRAESAEAGMAGALQRVVELQASLDILTEERDRSDTDAIADWEAEGGEPARGSVEELLSFNEKVTAATGKHAAEDAKLA
jgi:hypothetical protein